MYVLKCASLKLLSFQADVEYINFWNDCFLFLNRKCTHHSAHTLRTLIYISISHLKWRLPKIAKTFKLKRLCRFVFFFSVLFSLRCLCQNEFCTTILFIIVALFHFHTRFKKRLSFFLSKWIVMGMSSLRLSRRCYMHCRCCGARDKIYLSSTKHGSMFITPLTNLWLSLIISCKKFPLMILQ